MPTMSREAECSLARGLEETNGSKKEVMGAPELVSLEVELFCVHNLEALLDLGLKVACMDILALCKKKINAQANIVVAQFEVLIT